MKSKKKNNKVNMYMIVKKETFQIMAKNKEKAIKCCKEGRGCKIEEKWY